MAPNVWAMKQREDASHNWEALSEQLSPKMLTRYGLDTAVGITAIYGTPPGGGSQSADWAVNMTVIPSTQLARLLEDFPLAQFREVEVQNRHGDWLRPTTATIGAAFAAGRSPSFAATNDVAGAYPLTNLTTLYSVAGTLTPDEANALAAMVRYVATDGQDVAVASGGAPLTAAMVAEALAGADEIVTKNCAVGANAATYEVVTSGPIDFEPDTPKVQALTGLKHCALKPPPLPTTTTTTTSSAPTTTTVAAAATTVVAGASTTSTAVPTTTIVASLPPVPRAPTVAIPSAAIPPPIDDEPVASGGSSDTVVPVTDAAITTVASGDQVDAVATSTTELTTGGASPRVRGRTLDSLPLPTPSDGSGGFKKLGTLMIGAGTFLFCRRAVQNRRRVT